jgi:hypothetical protein
LWVVILLVAIGQLSDSKEVLSGDVLVVGQPGLLTIPHKLLSHIAPIAVFEQEFEPVVSFKTFELSGNLHA